MHDELKKQAERLVADLLFHKLPDRPVPEDFEAGLHRRLAEAADLRSRSVARWAAFLRPAFIAAAFLAVFAIGVVVGNAIQKGNADERGTDASDRGDDPPSPRLVATKTVVQPGTPVTIRLVYESAKDIEQVRFSIVLDRGVRFRSEDPEIASRSELEWEGSLVAGRNEIPIVVTVDEVGERVIRAHARFNGTTVENVVTLVAREDGHA